MTSRERRMLKKELLLEEKEIIVEKYIDSLEETLILSTEWYKSQLINRKLNKKIDKAIEILHAMKHCELLLGGYKKSNIDKLLEILGDKEWQQ